MSLNEESAAGLGQKILLESGTNELEVLTFRLDDSRYGINVAKVREVRLPPEVHPIPKAPAAIEGAFESRGKILPLINLRRFLQLDDYPPETLKEPRGTRVIVTEFNRALHAFRVDAVERIHRITWGEMTAVPEFGKSHNSALTAIATINGDFVQMLDFESIVDTMNRSIKLHINHVNLDSEFDRGEKLVILAEDSSMIRRVMVETLHNSGYKRAEAFPDGKAAWFRLNSLVQQNTRLPNAGIDLVVTDIEMPQIDGLHLTKLIREHPQLKDLPVVLFSSLITEDNRKKGEMVGATAQVSKPDLERLVELVDSFLDPKSPGPMTE